MVQALQTGSCKSIELSLNGDLARWDPWLPREAGPLAGTPCGTLALRDPWLPREAGTLAGTPPGWVEGYHDLQKVTRVTAPTTSKDLGLQTCPRAFPVFQSYAKSLQTVSNSKGLQVVLDP